MVRLLLGPAAAAALLAAASPTAALRPRFSWDTVGNMSFFHSCNESGLFSAAALDTIQKFPFVTVEKGQGYNDGSGMYAETKITAQLKAVKERDPTISTVFYMNAVLSWYFYDMNVVYEQHPEQWLYDSHTHEVVKEGGDSHFDPPKGGMLVFNHANAALREFWKATCFNATASGYVDGCFSDSSQPDSHGTAKHLNASDHAAFESGKVQTMSEVTAAFGGAAGQPYPDDATGVLIGKKPDQQGINAYQIEFFSANEGSIQELLAGVEQGYLVQAHVEPGQLASCGCACNAMEDSLAAFLIGAGDNCYYGTGSWIAANLSDVQNRWCPDLMERPLGPPLANATKDEDGVYHRNFTSGTTVEFNTKTKKGTIHWAGDPPAPAPAPAPAPPPPPGPPVPAECGTLLQNTGVANHDVTNMTTGLAGPAPCCALCMDDPECAIWAWHGELSPTECHLHAADAKLRPGHPKGCWAGEVKR